jgi:hypothetical protein
MSSIHTILHGENTELPAELYIIFELSDKKWQLTLSDGRKGPSRYAVNAGFLILQVWPRLGLKTPYRCIRLN